MAALLARSRALSAALALLAAACDLRAPPEPEPPRAALIAPPRASATTAPTSTIAAPPASSEASPAPRSDCALRLLPVEFTECNPKPTQHDYPECWTYAVDPGEEPAADPDAGSRGCLPRHVTLNVTGWQTVDGVQARVDYDPARPLEARLVLESKASTTLSPHSKTGDLLGTITFEKGVASELRFGPGMISRTHVASLRRDPP